MFVAHPVAKGFFLSTSRPELLTLRTNSPVFAVVNAVLSGYFEYERLVLHPASKRTHTDLGYFCGNVKLGKVSACERVAVNRGDFILNRPFRSRVTGGVSNDCVGKVVDNAVFVGGIDCVTHIYYEVGYVGHVSERTGSDGFYASGDVNFAGK